MDKEIAIAVVAAIREFETPVNHLTELSYKINDEAERSQLRQHVTNIVAITTGDLLDFIVARYPDLDPYKNYFQDKSLPPSS